MAFRDGDLRSLGIRIHIGIALVLVWIEIVIILYLKHLGIGNGIIVELVCPNPMNNVASTAQLETGACVLAYPYYRTPPEDPRSLRPAVCTCSNAGVSWFLNHSPCRRPRWELDRLCLAASFMTGKGRISSWRTSFCHILPKGTSLPLPIQMPWTGLPPHCLGITTAPETSPQRITGAGWHGTTE